MQDDIPSQGIAVGGFQAMWQVLDVNAPTAVASLTNHIFAYGGTVAVLRIAGNRLFPGQIRSPRTLTATMTYQETMRNGITCKVPDKEPLKAGMPAQVNMYVEVGIEFAPLANRLASWAFNRIADSFLFQSCPYILHLQQYCSLR